MSDQVQSNQSTVADLANGPDSQPETLAEVAALPGVRERIVREAIRLFSTKGYNGVSVREIVEAARITKPTLYYYYPSKEILFQRIITDTLEEFRQQLEAAVKQPGPIAERLLRICRVHFEFARCNAEHCQLVHSLNFSNESKLIQFDFDAYFKGNAEMIRDVIAEGIVSKELRAGDPWLMALVFIGAMHIFIMAMLRDPSAIPSEGLAEIVVEATLKGMEKRTMNDE
jgi:AcrR family transcriptional regulator